MKRIIVSLLLIMSLLLSAALAESSINLDAMTDEEIVQLMNQCQSALAEKTIAPETVLYSDEELGVTVTITGYEFEDKHCWLSVYGTVINQSDKNVEVKAEEYDIYVNNWQIQCFGNEILESEPGRNYKGRIIRALDLDTAAEVTKAEDLSIVEGTYLITIGDQEIRIPFVITDFSSFT